MKRWRACLAVAAVLPMSVAAQQADDYGAMLSYLNHTRMDGSVLRDAAGAITVNMVAGDLNQQVNLLGMASGEMAASNINARQRQSSNRVSAGLLDASASIGGQVLNGASGVAMISQASGIGNATVNVVTATLAQQGIRESDDEALAASGALASAGGQDLAISRKAAGTRSVAVEDSALRGFDGVLQLNQIAGSGNVTANQLGVSVQSTP